MSDGEVYTAKVDHASQNRQYAKLKLKQGDDNSDIHVFSFEISGNRRKGTVTHIASQDLIDMKYSNGKPVEGDDAVTLADALLHWLADHDYLEMAEAERK